MPRGEGGGQPTKFTKAMQEKLLEGIEKCVVLTQAAGYARVSRQSVYNWLEIGKKDIIAGNYTEYANFFYELKNAQSKKVAKYVAKIEAHITNWQASAWLLERCYREDFGADAGIIQELLAKCEKLEEDFKKLNQDPLKGAVSNG